MSAPKWTRFEKEEQAAFELGMPPGDIVRKSRRELKNFIRQAEGGRLVTRTERTSAPPVENLEAYRMISGNSKATYDRLEEIQLQDALLQGEADDESKERRLPMGVGIGGAIQLPDVTMNSLIRQADGAKALKDKITDVIRIAEDLDKQIETLSSLCRSQLNDFAGDELREIETEIRSRQQRIYQLVDWMERVVREVKQWIHRRASEMETLKATSVSAELVQRMQKRVPPYQLVAQFTETNAAVIKKKADRVSN